MGHRARLALSYLVPVTLVCAAYPLALAAHVALDSELGDALLLRELKYGSPRAVANQLVLGWKASLPWVFCTWLALAGLRRVLGRVYGVAVLSACAVAIAAAVAAPAVPPLLVSLLLACAALEAAANALSTRPRRVRCT